MASASRDGTPGRRTHGKNAKPKGAKGKAAQGKNTQGKNTQGKSAQGQSAQGQSARGKAAQSKPRGVDNSANRKKPHRKGSRSAPDVASGRVRLNNAKAARAQLSGETGDGATYDAHGVRLQKVLAQAGVASRRGAEEMIAAGRVSVDGEIVVEQGMRIDPDTSIVRVDGARVIVDESKQYLALNKPKGYHSTMADDQGRPCIGDIVAERVMAGQRLFHVGRLDAETEGLILLTNDGELAHRLMHPSYEVPKTYLATVRGEVPRGLVRTLRAGVELDDGPVAVDKVTILEVHEGRSLLRLTLHEGRKRVVRRIFDEVGFPVKRLLRTDIGVVHLGEQRPGSLRVLGNDEVGALYKSVRM